MRTIPKYFVITGFLVALFSTQPVVAGTNTPRIDTRENNQQRRIDQGTASGQLRPSEAHRLEAQQNRIERAEDVAKSDGVVTRSERINLTHQQNKASRNIYRKKHNRRN